MATKLTEEQVDILVKETLLWAPVNGLVVGAEPPYSVHAPVSLLPTPLPRQLYAQAWSLAKIFNKLVDKLANDADFLQTTLHGTRDGDAFTARLLDLHTTTRASKGTASNDVRLGLFRSDYMLDTPSGGILQVELNTISSSFAGLSSQVTSLHRYLLGVAQPWLAMDPAKCPANDAAAGFAEALAIAAKRSSDDGAEVLFIVQEAERNVFDQHWLSVLLWRDHQVRSIRRTLRQVKEKAVVDGASGQLSIEGHRIAVIYYRAGYTPDDYPTELEWEARELLEKSSAIKCPDVASHLAGAKKIQQALAAPGVLEKFITDATEAAEARKTFAGLWGLEGDEGTAIMKEAVAKPAAYVLKPQREGGGNNLYGEELKAKLEEILASENSSERGAYILMQRILPPENPGRLLRQGKHYQAATLSELGIFGAYLRIGDEVVVDRATGHLLRTKVASSDEGGVAAGYAVLDSPYLV